jgi:hypothetical protein
MKIKSQNILLLFFLLLTSKPSVSQDTAPGSGLSYFIVLYTTGANWDQSKPAGEQEYFRDHSAYLAELRKSDLIHLGGRYSDTGMILLRALDEAEARDMVNKDVAVRNKLFKAEVYPFSAFYKGCVK